MLGEFPWSALYADNDMIEEATKPVKLPLGMNLGFSTVKLPREESSGDQYDCE
jgi:hypothetical protein